MRFRQKCIPEGRVELHLLLGHVLDALAEALEGHLELVAQLALALLGRQVVAVVHVLVLAEVRRDLAHLRVELDVHVLLLACNIIIRSQHMIHKKEYLPHVNTIFFNCQHKENY